MQTAFGADEAVRVHFQISVSPGKGVISNSTMIDHRSEIAEMPLISLFLKKKKIYSSALFRMTMVPFPCGFPAAYGKNA